jgi:hypothetical protein
MEPEERELANPSPAVLELMKSHLAEEHGRDFELERDLSMSGRPNPDAMLSYRGENAGGAGEGFWCREHPGLIFTVDPEPALSAERIAHLARLDPELQSRLAEVPETEHAELVQAYEEEKQAAELLKRFRKRRRQRTAKPQPAAQERREGAQAYLLAKYEEIGLVDEICWDLLHLRNRDPAAYREVIGSDEPYKLETVRKWWYEIPESEREAAKHRYLDSQGEQPGP